MKVLIACEESQTVCKAFRALGHEAYSCDIQECSGGHPEWHIQGDAITEAYRGGGYDMMIAHPPCTYISYAGIRWFNIHRYGNAAIERIDKMNDAIKFFLLMWNAPIGKICIENPRGFIQNFLKPSQTIQPYYFGDETSKTTLLWLKGLEPLAHTKGNDLFNTKTHVFKGAMCSSGSEALFGTHTLRLSKAERSKLRSKTFPGIAQAMALQWGGNINQIKTA